MAWVIRRIALPFVVGSALCIILLLALVFWTGDAGLSLRLHDLELVALFVVLFQAAGLALFVPTALLLVRSSIQGPKYLILLALLGAVLGIVVMLPIMSAGRRLIDLSLPAGCGALSALVWFAFNQNANTRT